MLTEQQLLQYTDVLDKYLQAVRDTQVDDDLLKFLDEQFVVIQQSVLLEQAKAVLIQFDPKLEDFPNLGVCDAMGKICHAIGTNEEDRKTFMKGLILISLHNPPYLDYSPLIYAFAICVKFLQVERFRHNFTDEQITQFIRDKNKPPVKEVFSLPFLLTFSELEHLIILLKNNKVLKDSGCTFSISTDEHSTNGLYKTKKFSYYDANYSYGNQNANDTQTLMAQIKKAICINSYENSQSEQDKVFPFHVSIFHDANSKKSKPNIALVVEKIMPDFEYLRAIKRVCSETNVTAIWLAAQVGNAKAIALFGHWGANPNIPHNLNGFTPLMVAIGHYHFDAAWELTQFFKSKSGSQNTIELDLSIQNKQGRTALHMAVVSGKKDFVQLILQNIEDNQLTVIANIEDNSQKNAFYLACELHQEASAELILKYEVTCGDAALLKAIENGNIEDLKKIVEYLRAYSPVQDFDARKNNVFCSVTGRTPIEIAVDNDDEKMLELLLDNGFQAKIVNQITSKPPLFKTIEKQNFSMFEMIITKQPQALMADDLTTFNSPLHAAVLENDERFVRAICDAGRQPLDVYKHENGLAGETALFIAVRKEKRNYVQILLEAGADAEKGRNDSNSPLLEAIELGNLPIVELLAAHNANLNAYNPYKKVSMLSRAIKLQDVEIVKTLIRFGADVNGLEEFQNRNRTPLFYAIRSGNTELCKILLENGADIHFIFENVFSPLELEMASGEYNKEIVNLLLQYGCNPHFSADDYSKTPYQIADEKNDEEILWLMNYYQCHTLQQKINAVLDVAGSVTGVNFSGIGLANPISIMRSRLMQVASQFDLQGTNTINPEAIRDLEKNTQLIIAEILIQSKQDFVLPQNIQSRIDWYVKHIKPCDDVALDNQFNLSCTIDFLTGAFQSNLTPPSM